MLAVCYFSCRLNNYLCSAHEETIESFEIACTVNVSKPIHFESRLNCLNPYSGTNRSSAAMPRYSLMCILLWNMNIGMKYRAWIHYFCYAAWLYYSFRIKKLLCFWRRIDLIKSCFHPSLPSHRIFLYRRTTDKFIGIGNGLEVPQIHMWFDYLCTWKKHGWMNETCI